MALKAVIFDMDDTLVDWSSLLMEDRLEGRRKHLSQFHRYLCNAGYSLPEIDEFVKLYYAVLLEMWDEFDGTSENPPRYADMLAEMLIRLEIDISQFDLMELPNQIVSVLQQGVVAYPDARMVLESIRQSGLLTGLLTNAPYPIHIRQAELEGMQLMDLFDIKVTAEDIRYKKPNPRAFKVVLDRLGVLPEEAVYVGDLLKDDVMGSQSAGMKAVWIRRRGEEVIDDIQPDATIDHLTELLDVLPRWR